MGSAIRMVICSRTDRMIETNKNGIFLFLMIVTLKLSHNQLFLFNTERERPSPVDNISNPL